MKAVLVTAGLDDSTRQIESIVSKWDKDKFTVVVRPFGWQSTEQTTEELKANYLAEIEELYRLLGTVTLVGVSAGGAASIWAAEQLPGMVNQVIDVCGAVRLPRLTWISKHFGSNGVRFDEVMGEIQDISATTTEKLTILKPFLYDGLVRRSSFRKPGARIRTLPIPTHIAAIKRALKKEVPDMIGS